MSSTGPLRERARARSGRWALVSTLVVALVLATTLVWQSSYAGFTDTTGQLHPSVTTGTVVLADDDAGARMFNLSRLKPGATGTRCVKVTSTGSVPAVVRLYGTGRRSSHDLDRYLTLAISVGTGGSSASCSGFTGATSIYSGSLADFAAGYAAGVGSWTTTGKVSGETRTYRIAYTMAEDPAGNSQAGSAAITFVWEAQSP